MDKFSCSRQTLEFFLSSDHVISYRVSASLQLQRSTSTNPYSVYHPVSFVVLQAVRQLNYIAYDHIIIQQFTVVVKGTQQ
jgi:hypothetical protein